MILKDLRSQPDGLDLLWSLFDTSDLFLALGSATTSDSAPPRLLSYGAHQKRLHAKFGGLDAAFGKAIEDVVAWRIEGKFWEGDLYRIYQGRRVYGDYYFIPPRSWPDGKLGLFQTRRCAWRRADEGEIVNRVQKTIVEQSCYQLREFALENSQARIDMPCPDVHGLEFSEIKQFIGMLPDNVFVWRV